MSNTIKQLAGQTAIYGVSSIVGRLLNYLLVPLYTRIFLPEEYGTVTEMYAYVAFLVVILSYGMETAFFRYSELEKNKDRVYSSCLISLISTSLLFVLFASLFSQNIANLLRYPNNSEYVIWFALIVSLDALTTIPFAKLRAENKAKRFAIVKLINIGVNIGLNLFFIILCPYLLKKGIMVDFINMVFKGEVGVGYIFISNLIASIVTVVLLLPEILGVSFVFDVKLWLTLIIYASPLLIANFAGIINETLDRILLKYLLPQDISMAQVGIYGACYKIAILMTIFIQAFRYAAEPFFFAQAKEKNAKNMYAEVMNYFVIAGSFIILCTMMYIDIVIRFVGEDFRSGAAVIPILLFANLFLGIFYNLSIWYKLINKTKYGAYLAIFGAVVTLGLNFYWIPRIGYMGSAWATFICYASMMVLSYIIGQRHYPINYNLKKIVGYSGSVFLFYLISNYLNIETQSLRLLVNSGFVVLFISMIYIVEKPKLKLN